MRFDSWTGPVFRAVCVHSLPGWRSDTAAGLEKRIPAFTLRILLACMLLLFLSSGSAAAQERPHVEFQHEEETLVVTADSLETVAEGNLVAQGTVVATYGEATLKADRLVFNPEQNEILIEGNIELIRGEEWLKGTRALIRLKDGTGFIDNVSGFTDEEIYVRARKLTRVDADHYLVEEGYLTACEDEVPKWSFKISRATIDVKGSARMNNTIFRIKKVPVLYFPWMKLPTGRKERSSGFLIPTIGNSRSKGFRITPRVYLVLGRSTDLMIETDYFTKRGLGSSFRLRTKPNEVTWLDLTSAFQNDREGRGGASIHGIAMTRFGNGYRAAADFSLSTSFLYRQTFSDTFFTATRPTDSSRFFMSHTRHARSFNVSLLREETISRKQNIFIQSIPNIGYDFNGQRIAGSFLYLDLDSSFGGMSRSDRFIDTPGFSPRLDLFPRLYFSLPLFQGLRITPRIGFRETFYGDSIERNENGDRQVSGNNLHRNYFYMSVDVNGWGLSKIFKDDSGRKWKHLIEPVFRYQRIHGINNFDEIIRYDDVDTFADTNEIEYGIVNRLFVRDSKTSAPREWMSVKIGQKHFFDPTFGGAIREGSINQFYPLNELTGIPYAVGNRHFSPVTASVRFNPNLQTSFDIRSDFDTEEGDFRNISVTGFWRPGFFSVATTYFVTGELTENYDRRNQIQGRVGIGNARRGLSAYTGFSLDLQDSKLLTHLIRVSYFWECCGVSAEVQGFNLASRQETQVRFSFFLKGIGAFGTIRRPDNIF